MYFGWLGFQKDFYGRTCAMRRSKFYSCSCLLAVAGLGWFGAQSEAIGADSEQATSTFPLTQCDITAAASDETSCLSDTRKVYLNDGTLVRDKDNTHIQGTRSRSQSSGLSIPIDAFGLCRYVYNNSNNSIFIPVNTQKEWGAFIQYAPTNVHAYGCSRGGAITVPSVFGSNAQANQCTTLIGSTQTITAPYAPYSNASRDPSTLLISMPPTYTASSQPITYSCQSADSTVFSETAVAVLTGKDSRDDESAQTTGKTVLLSNLPVGWTISNVLYTYDGVCGNANGKELASPPTAASDLCHVGVSSEVTQDSETGKWSWTCSAGNGGGTQASCGTIQENKSPVDVTTPSAQCTSYVKTPVDLSIVLDASKSMSPVLKSEAAAFSTLLSKFQSASSNVKYSVILAGGHDYTGLYYTPENGSAAQTVHWKSNAFGYPYDLLAGYFASRPVYEYLSYWNKVSLATYNAFTGTKKTDTLLTNGTTAYYTEKSAADLATGGYPTLYGACQYGHLINGTFGPHGSADVSNMVSALNNITTDNMTPLVAAINLAAQDLTDATHDRAIIVIGDGQESCVDIVNANKSYRIMSPGWWRDSDGDLVPQFSSSYNSTTGLTTYTCTTMAPTSTPSGYTGWQRYTPDLQDDIINAITTAKSSGIKFYGIYLRIPEDHLYVTTLGTSKATTIKTDYKNASEGDKSFYGSYQSYATSSSYTDTSSVYDAIKTVPSTTDASNLTIEDGSLGTALSEILNKAVTTSTVSLTAELSDSTGTVLQSNIAGGTVLSLPPGDYTIKYTLGSKTSMDTFTVTSSTPVTLKTTLSCP